MRRRRLRAVFAADVVNFGGLMSADETRTLDDLSIIRRIAKQELATHGGWLFGMPGDGLFALFESAVDAVNCALLTQDKLAAVPRMDRLRLRIGIHLGDVLFQDDLPFGETLVIAARLESLAQPGGTLVSATVMEAVAPRISATFQDQGLQALKHSPRRIAAYSVKSTPGAPALELTKSDQFGVQLPSLDRTLRFTRRSFEEAQASEHDAQLSPVPSLPVTPQHSLPLPEPTPKPPLAIATAAVAAPRSSTALSADPAPVLPLATELAPHPAIEAGLPALTHLLITLIGPMARILIAREARSATTPTALINRLAEAIGHAAERQHFIEAAHKIFQ
jgi:class 3 adenylate cyclase